MSLQIILDKQRHEEFLTMLYDGHTMMKLPNTHVLNI